MRRAKTNTRHRRHHRGLGDPPESHAWMARVAAQTAVTAAERSVKATERGSCSEALHHLGKAHRALARAFVHAAGSQGRASDPVMLEGAEKMVDGAESRIIRVCLRRRTR